MDITVNAVAFFDEGVWVAQCLEYDIVATAKSMQKLRKAFEKAVVANLCVNAELGRNGLDGIPPAPDHFRELFDNSEYGLLPNRAQPSTRPGLRIEDVRLADADA